MTSIQGDNVRGITINLDEPHDIEVAVAGNQVNLGISTRAPTVQDIERMMRENNLWIGHEGYIDEMDEDDIELRNAIERTREGLYYTRKDYIDKKELETSDMVLKYPVVAVDGTKSNWAIFGQELKNKSDSYEFLYDDINLNKVTSFDILRNGYEKLKRVDVDGYRTYLEGDTVDFILARMKEEHKEHIFVPTYKMNSWFNGRTDPRMDFLFNKYVAEHREDFMKPLVLIPQLNSDHWTMTALIGFYGNAGGTPMMMFHFDSFPELSQASYKNAKNLVGRLVRVLSGPHSYKKKRPAWDWTRVYSHLTNTNNGWPRQQKTDCGVFACMFARRTIDHFEEIKNLRPTTSENSSEIVAFFGGHAGDFFLRQEPEEVTETMRNLRLSWSASIAALQRLDTRTYTKKYTGGNVPAAPLDDQLTAYINEEINRLNQSEATRDEAAFKRNLFGLNNDVGVDGNGPNGEINNQEREGVSDELSGAVDNTNENNEDEAEDNENNEDEAEDNENNEDEAEDNENNEDEAEDNENNEDEAEDEDPDDANNRNGTDNRGNGVEEFLCIPCGPAEDEQSYYTEEQRNNFNGTKRRKACDCCSDRKKRCHSHQPYPGGGRICFHCVEHRKMRGGPCHFSRAMKPGRKKKCFARRGTVPRVVRVEVEQDDGDDADPPAADPPAADPPAGVSDNAVVPVIAPNVIAPNAVVPVIAPNVIAPNAVVPVIAPNVIAPNGPNGPTANVSNGSSSPDGATASRGRGAMPRPNEVSPEDRRGSARRDRPFLPLPNNKRRATLPGMHSGANGNNSGNNGNNFGNNGNNFGTPGVHPVLRTHGEINYNYHYYQGTGPVYNRAANPIYNSNTNPVHNTNTFNTGGGALYNHVHRVGERNRRSRSGSSRSRSGSSRSHSSSSRSHSSSSRSDDSTNSSVSSGGNANRNGRN